MAAGPLSVDGDGIQSLDGQRAAVRVTRGDRTALGWECEVERGGLRQGERWYAGMYVVVQVARQSNAIVGITAWNAAAVRPLLTGKPGTRHSWWRAFGRRGMPIHGLQLNLSHPKVRTLGYDLGQRLHELERRR